MVEEQKTEPTMVVNMKTSY